MKNLEKEKSGINLGFVSAAQGAMSKRQSQVHFYVSTDKYKKLKRVGIHKEQSIGEMFNDMLDRYLSNNKDY